MGAVESLANDPHSFSTVDFFVDSQGAIKALNSPWPVSTLVAEAIEALNHFGRAKNLTIHWIPSHHGHEGNEVADELAKEATRSAFLGPQPPLPLSRRDRKR